MFHKILIANRGEIACRVIRTAKDRGYRTVAVYSDADAGAPHVQQADEAVHIGPPPARDSYLNIDALLEAARATGADAVHPGYGFLSERADFVRACEKAGLTFIGPPPDAMELMGSKRASKDAMEKAGVPVVPGFSGDASDLNAWRKAADDIGYPVMIKASAGGGGRGMRLVAQADNLADEIDRARSEAQQAFGDGELILEKAIVRPRHIEIQVFADNHGDAIHLGERDCSVQRRHQKVVEEAPSPFVTPELRQQMGDAAVQAAKACGYRGAGTVEFIVDESGAFYFLEMNTRLQVEHPVTECVTGLDLVALQLDIAAGKPLPLAQDDVQIRGHAIEVRLYAEDPAQNYLPQTGTILRWEPAEGDGIRIDSGIRTGQAVTPHYDPMIAKVIAAGPDRDSARRQLIRALEDTVLLGVTHNARFLAWILGHEVFAQGEATTAFLSDHQPDHGEVDEYHPFAQAALIRYCHDARQYTSHGDRCGWSNTLPGAFPMELELGEREERVLVTPSAGTVAIAVGEAQYEFLQPNCDGDTVFYSDGAVRQKCQYRIQGDHLYWLADGVSRRARESTYDPADPFGGEVSGDVRASMDGAIIALPVSDGDRVKAGQTVAVLEAMKMEHPLKAATDGTVSDVRVAEGDQVSTGALLLTVVPEE